MKRPLFVFPLAFLLIFLGMPEATLAKGRTVKIVISGGGLTSAIVVPGGARFRQGSTIR